VGDGAVAFKSSAAISKNPLTHQYSSEWRSCDTNRYPTNDPEFLVYAATNAPRVDGVARTRLAAVEYFLPFSAKWPAQDDPAFVKAPTLHDFPTTSGLPDVAFTPSSRFGGWMFHIWLGENNPAGMFENFNTSVPLCLGSSF
jgi:hypothetical protein